MAKAAPQVPAKRQEEDPNNPLAVFGGNTSLEALGKELEGLTGLGYSEKAEDALIPIVSILQDNSGEVKNKHPRRIEGAMAGELIIRALKQTFEGEKEGILFQPCAFQHVWVEWEGEVGEGRPVMTYPFDDKPPQAREVADPQDETRKSWVMPNNNRLVDTRYHYGYLIMGDRSIAVVIPMSGSNHSISRQWTAVMKEIRIPSTGQKAPSWFRIYKMRSAFSQRGQLTWYKYVIDDAGWVGNADMRAAGRTLYEAVTQMRIKPDLEAEAEETSGGAGNGLAADEYVDNTTGEVRKRGDGGAGDPGVTQADPRGQAPI